MTLSLFQNFLYNGGVEHATSRMRCGRKGPGRVFNVYCGVLRLLWGRVPLRRVCLMGRYSYPDYMHADGMHPAFQDHPSRHHRESTGASVVALSKTAAGPHIRLLLVDAPLSVNAKGPLPLFAHWVSLAAFSCGSHIHIHIHYMH